MKKKRIQMFETIRDVFNKKVGLHSTVSSSRSIGVIGAIVVTLLSAPGFWTLPDVPTEPHLSLWLAPEGNNS